MAVKGILELKEILDEYSQDIQDGIVKAAEDISKEGVAELKNTSPKKTGSYRKGWRVKKTKGAYSISCIIHNATDYQLTHLLEKPHVIRNAYGTYGTSRPQVHIKPVEEQCRNKFDHEVQEIIRNG